MDTPRDERGKHRSDTKRGEKPPTVSRRAIGVDSWRMSATTVDQVRALTQLEKKEEEEEEGKWENVIENQGRATVVGETLLTTV